MERREVLPGGIRGAGGSEGAGRLEWVNVRMVTQNTVEEHTRVCSLFLETCDLDEQEQTTRLDLVPDLTPTARRVIKAMLAQDRLVRRAVRPHAGAPSAKTVSIDIRAEQSRFDPTTIVKDESPDTADKPESDFPSIDGYVIRSVLGHGGMGVVYRALHLDLRREVAVKILPALVGTADPGLVERFKREAAAAASLRHRNIVPIYDFGKSAAGYYYSMEFIDGVSLDVVINARKHENDTSLEAEAAALDALNVPFRLVPKSVRQRSYFRQVASWMIDTCSALAAAKQAGIIHRDIKPGNLLVSTQGRIVVADFGLARADHDDSMTVKHSVMGTLRYMSPEQILGGRVPIDHRSDLYSLGATLYELLTLKPLFGGRDQDQLIKAVVETTPPRPSTINADVPRDLDVICMKLLEKLPENRYAQADEVADDLQAFLETRLISARPPSWHRRFVQFLRKHRIGISVTVALSVIASLIWFQVLGARQRRINEEVARLIGKALVLQQSHQWRLAADTYRSAFALDPDNVRAMGNMAIVLKELYNESVVPDSALLTEANEYCDRALAENAQRPGLWNVKGVLLKKLGDLEGAVDAYKTALLQSSDQATMTVAVLNNLAEVYWLLGDPDSAEESLRRSAEVARSKNIPAWYTWCDLASLQLSQQDEAAIESIDQSFKDKPEPGWRQHLIRARIHLELNGHVDPAEALRDALAANEQSRPDAKIQRILALAWLRSGRYQEALETADNVIQLGGSTAFADLIAAIAHARRLEFDSCKERMTRAREAWPDESAIVGYTVSTDRAMLWFDSSEQLDKLWNEAEELLGGDK